MTVTNLTYSTTTLKEETPDVTNADMTIQGGTGTYVKYYNSTITTINHDFKAIVGKNNFINTYNSSAQIIASEYTSVTTNGGTSILKNGNHNSIIAYNSETELNNENYTKVTINGGSSTIQEGIFNKLIAYNTTIKFFKEYNNYASIHDSSLTMDFGYGNTVKAYNTNVNVIDEVSSQVTVTGGSLAVTNGWSNNFTTDSDITFNNGYGNTEITVGGQAQIVGRSELNLTLNAYSSNKSALFVASNGNQTLNGGTSTAAIHVYASSSDTNSTLKATTGSGDDFLFAGNGNSTFTGGAGNNLFVFNKNNDTGGTTVISDFSASSGNKIWLSNYGLNQNSLNTLLASSHNDSSGNAILNLNNDHQITIQNVSIQELHSTQFIITG